MNKNFSGYKENVLTFAYTGTLAAGDLVKMSSSGTVAKAAANDAFIGVCLSVRSGCAAVQLDGYTEAKKNGTISVGSAILVAASDGVKTAESGEARLVIYSDETTVGFLI